MADSTSGRSKRNRTRFSSVGVSTTSNRGLESDSEDGERRLSRTKRPRLLRHNSSADGAGGVASGGTAVRTRKRQTPGALVQECTTTKIAKREEKDESKSS